ncbi:MAG: response regulator [Clostridium sp.]|nr:response regulator [Clostridium sp.]
MKHSRLLYILLLISTTLGIALPVSAARVYSFNAISNDEGLSSNCVKTILRDSYDFMWFGTKNGLNRYDGQTIRQFNCFDPKARRGNNNIGALYEDSEANLWVGTDRGVYIFNPETETFSYFDRKSKDGHGVDNWIQEICGDTEGNIWILAPGQGLFKVTADDVEFHRIATSDDSRDDKTASIGSTSSGEIFAGTIHGGLLRYDPLHHQFKQIQGPDPIYSRLREKTIQAIRETSNGRLLIGTQDGELYRINPTTMEIRAVRFTQHGKIYLRSLLVYDEEIWVGTQNGIHIINETDQNEQYLTAASHNVNGLSDNLIYTMLADTDNNVWIGTMFGGVSFYQRRGFAIERFLAGNSPSLLSSNRIRGMAKGSDGRILIGTEDGGVNLFNPLNGSVEPLSHHSSQKSTSLIIRCFDGQIYSGLSREGVEIFSPGMTVSRVAATDLIGSNSSVYAVLSDRDGSLWIGADWGLFRRKKGEEKFERIREMNDIWVFDMIQSSDGSIWIAGMGYGVCRIDPVSGKIRKYIFDEAHTNGLRSNSVSSIMEDSRGTIWVSTDRGGLSRYQPETDNFATIDMEDGLPDNVVYDLLEDSRGFLWFGTNRGLVKYDPRNSVIKVFTTADGLPGNQFNYHAAVIGDDGWFYFGTINGLIAFNPETETGEHLSPVYFTSLRLGNSEITPTTPGSPLKKTMMFNDRIDLPYDATHISLAVAIPNYSNKGSLRYSYRIKPLSDDWISLPADQNISFASLAPGDYFLDVRVSGDGNERIKSLQIHVERPWYARWWAWLLYLLVICIVVAAAFIIWKNRRERSQREREYMMKIRTDKELYENKIKFFSEIAHEIRTPLTLIKTPLEAIEEIGVEDSRVDRYLKMMRKNTTRLLELVSQLLDFHKIGNSREKLNFEYINVSALVSDTAARFQDSITLRGKTLTLKLPETAVQATVDKEAVTKIISNLLSNAMKYASHDIEASLTSDDKELKFSVRSDGNKITGEDVYSIFTPFYRLEMDSDAGGVGIGLPLSRVLASIHNGSLILEEDSSSFNTFTLTLPLKQEGVESPIDNADPVMADFVMEDEPQPVAGETPSGYSLLLVEDNSEMRAFLNEQLSHHFVVDTAENGKEAVELLKTNRYDIIVTDIMMPEMDGYEFCRKVKEDVELSHIPVVFLTAKNDLESKVEALKCGGEAYIEKPFSIKYFRQQVYSLLENRRHERRSLIKKPFFTVDNMQMSKADEEFMNKVVKTISDHIADEEFNVETMADVLCMSRSSLLRKIKALFNLSPIELIRLVKLKKSAELIKEGKYRIGDICYMVGINSPSYFSKLFQKQFGMTPKAFEMQCQKNSRENNKKS